MHLFITGANSFVGSHLQETCRTQGISYSGIDVMGPFSEAIRELDIRDAALTDHVPAGAVVVHLAAISRDPDCAADPEDAMTINIGGTTNVGLAAIAARARRLVFASSEWVYGRSPSAGPLTEEMGPAWGDLDSLYAFSKAAGERILWPISVQLPVSVLRFAIIYGPRASNWSAFEAMVSATVKGRVEVGSLDTARRFVHVDDVAEGIVAAAREPSEQSHTWNLAGPQLLSLGAVVDLAAQLLGTSVETREREPRLPSIRNPLPDQMALQLGWRATRHGAVGVADVLRFIGNEPV